MAGYGVRPDLNWLSLDVAFPSALPTAGHGPHGVRASGSALPIADRAASWICFRSSLHYIGLNRALREASRVARRPSTLVILAKVIDQFDTCPDWHLRLHHARSIVPRELYRSDELAAAVLSSGYSIRNHELLYRWTSYDLSTWADRGGELSAASREELRTVLQGADAIVATDGRRPLYQRAGKVHNRLQWCFIHAIL
jgi:hypothetical protein